MSESKITISASQTQQLPIVRGSCELAVLHENALTILLGRMQAALMTPGLGGVVEARRLYERLMTAQVRGNNLNQ